MVGRRFLLRQPIQLAITLLTVCGTRPKTQAASNDVGFTGPEGPPRYKLSPALCGICADLLGLCRPSGQNESTKLSLGSMEHRAGGVCLAGRGSGVVASAAPHGCRRIPLILFGQRAWRLKSSGALEVDGKFYGEGYPTMAISEKSPALQSSW